VIDTTEKRILTVHIKKLVSCITVHKSIARVETFHKAGQHIGLEITSSGWTDRNNDVY